jgi:hypothetical protein
MASSTGLGGIARASWRYYGIFQPPAVASVCQGTRATAAGVLPKFAVEGANIVGEQVRCLVEHVRALADRYRRASS